MIKFFRKIGENLLMEKTFKYYRFDIGKSKNEPVPQTDIN